MSRLTQSPAWIALEAHRHEIADQSLTGLFSADPGRGARFSIECGDLFVDWSKQRVTDKTMQLLRTFAVQSDVAGWRSRMFAGDAINSTEKRAALQSALRDEDSIATEDVRTVREQMRRFVESVIAGDIRGARGKPFAAVVNLGIGGSDSGPRLVAHALHGLGESGLTVRFTANADAADLNYALHGLDPATTLIVIASKTFGTVETINNARRAREWLRGTLGASAETHLAAITANRPAALDFGVATDRIFPMQDSIGGRFSVWSAVGLSAALALGWNSFERLLTGARAMDTHFRTAPLEANLPIVLALLSVWNTNFLGAQSEALLPYSERLRDLVSWLQQLSMESNGKSVDREDNPVDYTTAPIIWGGTGSTSQHSFHQLLHQGTRFVPVEFVVLADYDGDSGSHDLLVANAIAQAAALMTGAPDGQPHRRSPGNRPSTTIVLRKLTPESLGQLLALYEHRTFVNGVLWNINSFDQWGVELGKGIARRLAEGHPGELDPSSAALLRRARGESGTR